MMNWKQTAVLLGTMLFGSLIGSAPAFFMLAGDVSIWLVFGYLLLVSVLLARLSGRLIDKLGSTK